MYNQLPKASRVSSSRQRKSATLISQLAQHTYYNTQTQLTTSIKFLICRCVFRDFYGIHRPISFLCPKSSVSFWAEIFAFLLRHPEYFHKAPSGYTFVLQLNFSRNIPLFMIEIALNYHHSNSCNIFSGSSAAFTLSFAFTIIPCSSMRYVVLTTPIETLP